MLIYNEQKEYLVTFMDSNSTQLSFKQALLSQEKHYHIHHPFNVAMHEGRLTQKHLQAWVLNRFYYQAMIPRKDAAILSNCDDIQVRQIWIQRIQDHDGTPTQPGGIEAWLQLAQACGLSREETLSLKHVLPGVRFAVDAYYQFAKNAPWPEAICSSLTELFAPKIHQQRLNNWPKDYPWVKPEGLSYFQNRLSQARRDVEHGLAFVLDYFQTPEKQARAMEILQFKLNVLWSLSDAIMIQYPLEGL